MKQAARIIGVVGLMLGALPGWADCGCGEKAEQKNPSNPYSAQKPFTYREHPGSLVNPYSVQLQAGRSISEIKEELWANVVSTQELAEEVLSKAKEKKDNYQPPEAREATEDEYHQMFNAAIPFALHEIVRSLALIKYPHCPMHWMPGGVPRERGCMCP